MVKVMTRMNFNKEITMINTNTISQSQIIEDIHIIIHILNQIVIIKEHTHSIIIFKILKKALI